MILLLIALAGLGATYAYATKKKQLQQDQKRAAVLRTSPFNIGRPDMYPPSSHVRKVGTFEGAPVIFNPTSSSVKKVNAPSSGGGGAASPTSVPTGGGGGGTGGGRGRLLPVA